VQYSKYQNISGSSQAELKILLHPKYHHPKIEIIETMGELTGRKATLLEEFLYTCLDKGKY
jgi:hypothetical protein